MSYNTNFYCDNCDHEVEDVQEGDCEIICDECGLEGCEECIQTCKRCEKVFCSDCISDDEAKIIDHFEDTDQKVPRIVMLSKRHGCSDCFPFERY